MHGDHEEPVVVVLVAPAGCGKTLYLQALYQAAADAHHVVGDDYVQITPLAALAPSEESARQARQTFHQDFQRVRSGQQPGRTEWATEYGLEVSLLSGGRRRVYLLDTKGGDLFPRQRHPELDQVEEPDLPKRLEGLSWGDHPVCMLVFVNEPAGSTGVRQSGRVPFELTRYLAHQRIDRLAFYVGCADALFPRLKDLPGKIEELNRDALTERAFDHYERHFMGSPHQAFAYGLLRHLYAARNAAPDGEARPTEVGLFWGSSFGVNPRTGHANVNTSGGPNVLSNPDGWAPVGVIDPLLWCAGLDPSSRSQK